MAKQCLKCSKSMSQGFIPDYTYGGQAVGSWYAGAPEKSFWLGTKVAPQGGGIPIGAYRCIGCGYLELYADESFASK